MLLALLLFFAKLAAPLLLVFGVHVLEQFFNQIDVGEDHAAAAVAAELESVDGVPVGSCGQHAGGGYRRAEAGGAYTSVMPESSFSR